MVLVMMPLAFFLREPVAAVGTVRPGWNALCVLTGQLRAA